MLARANSTLNVKNAEFLPNLHASTSEEQSNVLVHLTPCPTVTYGQLGFACTRTGPTLNCFLTPIPPITNALMCVYPPEVN